ncbi:twin-arginine translocation pathway signal protein [Siccirubricoccus sp. KC 17139]|uniref:Twin-arginine translocation pathway signal protein n=1 Tax=Siccirubricoccus soli TaxID=2899147 RepID=A0ABT1D8P2_9PROT|nr:tripartite tricarboxylate transporter substrate-binding protein [Siccirubricoccus soli]MCO6418234.1 twin-arginine translocation pathway signal protein [Siccirubricoccus soli]MCP2684369.1 tripartite tricarboxylate transporter substrate-binding protein [Siccirubricoccus soli]
MTGRRAALAAALATPLLLPALRRATAQGAASGFPSRPIRVLVPFAPGGQSDTVIRLLAPKMGEVLGQGLVIENRPGGGGSIAGGVVAGAPADGRTLLFDSFGFLIIPFLVKGLSYDHDTAFAPVGQAVSAPYVLVVKKALPPRTLTEFIDYAKANPGVTYGSPGTGTVGHLAGALLASRAGIQLEHVPYRGGAEAARDLAAGSVDCAISTANSLRPLIEDGRGVGIALTSGERRGTLANLPTIAESGFPGFDLTSWNAMFAPAATPAPVIEKLEAAMRAAVQDEATRQRLILAGNDPSAEGAAAFAARIRREKEVVARIVRETGIKAD